MLCIIVSRLNEPVILVPASGTRLAAGWARVVETATLSPNGSAVGVGLRRLDTRGGGRRGG